MTTYLVTGATGLIGRAVTARLLARPGTARVYALVRAPSVARLEKAAAGWPGCDALVPLAGDITEVRCGVPGERIAALAGRVDHMVHLAALYDITAGEGASAEANVAGTEHAVELAAATAAGCLHHVSSVAVAGDFPGTFTEESFDEGQGFPAPYHRTKFAAERVVREQRDVPWRVYRPGVVVGDSVTGEIDKADGPYYLFPAIAKLAALPNVPLAAPPLGRTNIVPVDYVADAMVHLMHDPGPHGRTFHLVNPRPQPTTEVYNAFARPAGAPTIDIGLPGGLAKPLGRLASIAGALPGAQLVAATATEALGVPPEILGVATFRGVFDSTATQEALAGSGVAVPALQDYAGVLWRYWREHLDPERARRHGPAGELDGRRVVITGASSGIGRATALKVAARGGIPLLVARRAEELEALREEIAAAGGTASAYPADLTDGEAVGEMVKRMLAEHGGVEMVVNSAGRSIRRSIKLSYDRFHDFERAMAINYFGAARLILALLPHMTERRFGHVVNVSSIGVQGIAPRFSAYVASKAALDYFSRIVATETRGEGVTFTTVHMPLVATPMISPTKLYDAFPTKAPDEAAEMIVDALVRRPKHIGTPIGAAIGVTYSLLPGLVDAIAYQAYRMFPDSTAAGGDGGAALPARDRRLTGAPRALVRLTRGFHW